MGHHIDESGRFQSNKHPDLEQDKIVLSFRDKPAAVALLYYAKLVERYDPELSGDLRYRIYKMYPKLGPQFRS